MNTPPSSEGILTPKTDVQETFHKPKTQFYFSLSGKHSKKKKEKQHISAQCIRDLSGINIYLKFVLSLQFIKTVK